MNAPHTSEAVPPHSPNPLPAGAAQRHPPPASTDPESLVTGGPVVFSLNGEDVTAAPGETIIQAADRLGVAIPRLCYKPGYRADGNCRACMVEIAGERVLAPSCCRQPLAGMVVSSVSARALHSQKMIVELLASDMPERTYKTANELDYWKGALGIGTPRFARRAQPAADLSLAMADASICGLGQAAPNPIACVFKYFPDELSEERR